MQLNQAYGDTSQVNERKVLFPHDGRARLRSKEHRVGVTYTVRESGMGGCPRIYTSTSLPTRYPERVGVLVWIRREDSMFLCSLQNIDGLHLVRHFSPRQTEKLEERQSIHNAVPSA